MRESPSCQVISLKGTFSNRSASLYNPFCCPYSLSDFLCWDSVLWQPILPPHLRSSPSKTKHYHLRCLASSSHHNTNSDSHISRSNSRKVHRYSDLSDIRTGRYNPSIWAGFALWTLGLGLQTTFGPDISLGKIIGYLIVEGFGIGLTFQTSTSPTIDLLIRSLGRSTGDVTQERPRSSDGGTKLLQNNRGCLWSCKYSPYDISILIIVCSAILNNVLASRLAQETDLSPEVRQQIIRASLELPRDLTPAQMQTVMNAYVFFPVRIV